MKQGLAQSRGWGFTQPESVSRWESQLWAPQDAQLAWLAGGEGRARPQKTSLMSLLNDSWALSSSPAQGKQDLAKELFNPLWAGSPLRTGAVSPPQMELPEPLKPSPLSVPDFCSWWLMLEFLP